MDAWRKVPVGTQGAHTSSPSSNVSAKPAKLASQSDRGGRAAKKEKKAQAAGQGKSPIHDHTAPGTWIDTRKLAVEVWRAFGLGVTNFEHTSIHPAHSRARMKPAVRRDARVRIVGRVVFKIFFYIKVQSPTSSKLAKSIIKGARPKNSDIQTSAPFSASSCRLCER